MPKTLSEVVFDDFGNASNLRMGTTVTGLIRNVGAPRYVLVQDSGVYLGIYNSIVGAAPETATAFSRGKEEEMFGVRVIPIQYLREINTPLV